MLKKVIISGALGGIVLIVWIFTVNGMLGFQARIDMKQIDAERQVYEMLKVHIVDPGRYVMNPELKPGGPFPYGEPVFSVLYGGVGHEAAGSLMLLNLAVGFLTVIIGAWMLSQTSNQVLSSYSRKVIFFTAIGLLVAIFTDLTKFGIGGYPLKDAIFMAINHIVVWTLVGLAVAWKMTPDKTNAADIK